MGAVNLRTLVPIIDIYAFRYKREVQLWTNPLYTRSGASSFTEDSVRSEFQPPEAALLACFGLDLVRLDVLLILEEITTAESSSLANKGDSSKASSALADSLIELSED